MTTSAYTVTIGSYNLTPTNQDMFIERNSFRMGDNLGQRSKCDFVVSDMTGAMNIPDGSLVEVFDAAGALAWSGAVDSSDRTRNAVGTLTHDVKCVDPIYWVDKRKAAKAYASTAAGDAVGDLMTSYLNDEGILGTRTQPIFARTSTAYKLDGTSVTSGNPRYESGQIASSQAIMVEEGTTNLFSANQASVETDTSGFTVAGTGVTLTRDTTEHWSGAASLKAVCNGASTFQGFFAVIAAGSLVAGSTDTVSIWLKGSGGTVRFWLWAQTPDTDISSIQTVTLTSTWTRYTVTATLPNPLASTGYGIRIDTGSSAHAVTVYADGLQFEQKTHPTSWQLPGSARGAETLKLPAYGCISPRRGTIQFRAYIDSNARRQDNSQALFGVDFAPGGVGAAFSLFHSSNTAEWVLNIKQVDFTTRFNDSFTPDGWHVFTLAWDSASALLYVDGTLRATKNNPPLSTAFATYLYIGTHGGGSNAVNALYQDIRLSARKRTAAEIASDAALSTFLTMDDATSYLVSLNGVLSASTSIETGPTINEIIINYAKISDSMDGLAEVAAFWWNVDLYRLMHFRSPSTFVTANVVESLMDDGATPVSLRVSSELYRNREYIPGKETTSPQTETRKGDGATRTFIMSYPLIKVPSAITVNAVAKTIGILGVDSGKDFYWSENSDTITQDSGGTLLISTDTLSVTYQGTFPTIYVADDTAAISDRQTAEVVGTGIVEELDQIPTTSTVSASQYAGAKLARFAQVGYTLKFRSRTAGYRTGQLAQGVTVPSLNLTTPVDMLIQSVSGADNGLDIWYTVTAVAGPVNSTWLDFFKTLAGKAQSVDSLQLGANAPLVIAQNVSETWTWSESVTPAVQVCLICNVGTKCGVGQKVC